MAVGYVYGKAEYTKSDPLQCEISGHCVHMYFIPLDKIFNNRIYTEMMLVFSVLRLMQEVQMFLFSLTLSPLLSR